jgi:hypothetical protein
LHNRLILYDPAQKPVSIEAIVYGARDVRAILAKRRP